MFVEARNSKCFRSVPIVCKSVFSCVRPPACLFAGSCAGRLRSHKQARRPASGRADSLREEVRRSRWLVSGTANPAGSLQFMLLCVCDDRGDGTRQRPAQIACERERESGGSRLASWPFHDCECVCVCVCAWPTPTANRKIKPLKRALSNYRAGKTTAATGTSWRTNERASERTNERTKIASRDNDYDDERKSRKLESERASRVNSPTFSVALLAKLAQANKRTSSLLQMLALNAKSGV